MNLRFSKQSLSNFIVSYGTALLYVGLAFVVTLSVWQVIQPLASPLFLVASILTARKRGIKPGIVAILLSGLLIDYFFITPQYQLSGSLDDLVRLTIFSFEGFILCWLITDRMKTAEEVRESREQLLAASLRQQTLLENERKHIALEIHDELGQALTGLKMETHWLKKQIAETGIEKALEMDEKFNQLLNQIDATIISVRRIATELRPAILDDLGVVAAIEWQSQEFRRRTGIPCNLSANIEDLNLNSDSSTAIFRIYQEALTNVTRHAEARNINVDIKKLNQKLILSVEDDGKGIQIANDSKRNSLGIFGMHERARLIGGELKVFNSESGGTIVLLTAPLN